MSFYSVLSNLCADDVRDDITGLLDELVMNTKELIVETSREIAKWRK